MITTSIWGGRKNPGLVGMHVSSSTEDPIVTSHWNGRKVPWSDGIGKWYAGREKNSMEEASKKWMEMEMMKKKDMMGSTTEDPTPPDFSEKGKGLNPKVPNRNADSFWDEMFKEWNDRKNEILDDSPTSTTEDPTSGPTTTGWSGRKKSEWINPRLEKDGDMEVKYGKWSNNHASIWGTGMPYAMKGDMMGVTTEEPTPTTSIWSGGKKGGTWKSFTWKGKKDSSFELFHDDSMMSSSTTEPTTSNWSGRKHPGWIKDEEEPKWDSKGLDRSMGSKPKMSLEDYMKSLLVNKKK